MPLTVALPIVVALAMFVVALGSTQIGIGVIRRASEQMLHNQAQVFVDAVAGGIAQTAQQGTARVEEQLNSALQYRTALLEESIAARWRDEDGGIQTVFIGDRGQAELLRLLDTVLGSSEGMIEFVYDTNAETVAIVRTYEISSGSLAISALFDATSVFQTQRQAALAAVAINILVALVAAIATFFLTRAMLAPLRTFIERLAPEDRGSSVADLHRGPEVRRLEYALRLREQSEAQRAATADHMAQQERDAILARLAASVAHEVRNPLAGIKNGVSTLRRFGDDKDIRDETIELLDKGLVTIERVVDVTLATYRRRSDAGSISGRDIRDLDFLLRHEAGRAKVKLVWDVTDSDRIVTDADALRQVLINLILNAIRASPPSGSVTISLEPVSGGKGARISVTDEGSGMSAEQISSLVTGDVDDMPEERSLGIWLVANLVDRIGAHLSISSEVGRGTVIVIILEDQVSGYGETKQ